jgi:hypothetical protein
VKRKRGRPLKVDGKSPDWTHIDFRSYVQLAIRYGHTKTAALDLAAERFYPGGQKDVRDLRRLANQVRRYGQYRPIRPMFSPGAAGQDPTLADEIAQLERFLGPSRLPPKPR